MYRITTARRITKGFTIVELLIVIVIIAILAAITVVAFNGIQNRSRISKDTQDLLILTKAVRLYIANGGSMRDGVAGANNLGAGCGGLWYGGADSTYDCTKSMRQALVDNGYLPASFSRDFMIAFCNDASGPRADNRRAVLIRSSASLPQTPVQQISPSVCDNGNFNGYTSSPYNMNLVKMIE